MVRAFFNHFMTTGEIAEQLAELPTMSRVALCGLWQEVFKTTPSCKLRKDLLVRILAYRLQEQGFGGISDLSRRRLRQLASAFEADPNAAVSNRPPIKPGTRLVRQWKEQVHVVNVEAKGYEYRGDRYESLSEVARLITGSRWSGPLFFGLKRKPSGETQKPNER